MYNPNYYKRTYPYHYTTRYSPGYNDNRFIGGGFAVPFLLGGLTGGLLAPAFYPRPYPQPIPQPYPVPPPYPIYYN